LIKYYIRKDNALDNLLQREGGFPDWIAKNHTSIFTSPNAVVFDIGANAGYVTLPLLLNSKIGSIYAYEPDAANFEQLIKNLSINDTLTAGRVAPLRRALGGPGPPTEKVLYVRHLKDGDGALNTGLTSLVEQGLPFNKLERVTVTSIDNECNRLKLRRLDLIKIDTEGFEFEILMGGRTTLTNRVFRPFVIWEASPVIEKRHKSRYVADSFSYLDSIGYVNFCIDNPQGPYSEPLRIKNYNAYIDLGVDANILSIPFERLEGWFNAQRFSS